MEEEKLGREGGAVSTWGVTTAEGTTLDGDIGFEKEGPFVFCFVDATFGIGSRK
jgi:hypothetical protein